MFFDASRYLPVADYDIQDEAGNRRKLKAARELVPGEAAITYQVREGDRLDLLAFKFFGFPVGNLIGGEDQFGAAQAKAIPILLFVWGRKRVMPVVMTSLQITEQEYFPSLDPKRATAAVQLRVLEGLNPPYLYSHAWRIALGAMNLANVAELKNVF